MSQKSLIDVTVNGTKAKVLIDSGGSFRYKDEQILRNINLILMSMENMISMASNSLCCTIRYNCHLNLKIKEHIFPNIKVYVLPDSCVDSIIGHDILKEYENITITFNGTKPS